MKNQEAIQKAYEDLGINPLNHEFDGKNITLHHFKENDVPLLQLCRDGKLRPKGSIAHGVTKYCPSSLEGIETNNGWTRIESEADLPKESTYCWFILKGVDKIQYGRFILSLSNVKRFFLYDGDNYNYSEVTHYQPIIKPQPPIY